jgi:WD40 repeat protein
VLPKCVQVSSDYVGGLSILPGGNYVAAAAADGTLSLLEWRRAGETIASASCGSPVRCCSCDGHLLLCGTESGQLLLWNLDQMTGQGSGGSGKQGFSLAGPDGLYPALSCPSKAPVNCVAVAVGGPGGQQAEVAAALDDGSLVLFSSP